MTIASGSCGDNLTWTLNDDYSLVISGTGAMTDYQNNGQIPWYSYRSQIKSITFSSGITHIGRMAFQYLEHVTSPLIIPDTVTTIADNAFYFCTSIPSLTLSNSLTSIGNFAFFSCNSLNGTLTLPEGLTSIGDGAFLDCRKYTKLIIPSTLTNIGASAFAASYYVMWLADIYMYGVPTTIGSNAFSLGKSGALVACNVYSPNNIANNALEAYKGNYTTFAYQNAYIGTDGLLYTFLNNQLGANGSGAMTSLYRGSVSLQGGGTLDATAMTSATIGNGITSVSSQAFMYCRSLASVSIPNSVATLGDYAFMGTALTSVVIPSSITVIPQYAFAACTSLTSVTIPNSVTTIKENAFTGCQSLTSISIPNSVTTIESHAFDSCYSLTSVTIPASVTTIGVCPFRSCITLTSISVDASNPNYSSENGILFNKTKTILIEYPEGRTNTSYTIPNSVTAIEGEAFYYCSHLTTMVVPDSVTSIGASAFSLCTQLISIVLPNSITSIPSSMLYNCYNLESITIPASVTSIGYGAFNLCTSMNTIIFEGLQSPSIGNRAFWLGTVETSVTATVISPNNWAASVLDNYKNQYTTFVYRPTIATLDVKVNGSWTEGGVWVKVPITRNINNTLAGYTNTELASRTTGDLTATWVESKKIYVKINDTWVEK